MLSDPASIHWPGIFRSAATFPNVPSLRLTFVTFNIGDTTLMPMKGGLPLDKSVEVEAVQAGVPVVIRGIQTAVDLFNPRLLGVNEGEPCIVVANRALSLFPDSAVLKHNPRDALLKVFFSLPFQS